MRSRRTMMPALRGPSEMSVGIRRLLGIVALSGAVLTLVAPPRPLPRKDGVVLTPSKLLLQYVGRPVNELLADAFWLKAINVAGGRPGESASREIYAYFDTMASLDAKFYYPHFFVGVILPVHDGTSWKMGDLAADVFQRGLQQYPSDMQLTFFAANNELSYRNDRRKAAELFARTARLPGAPPFVASLAAKLLATEGDTDSSLALVKELRENTHDEDLRAVLERREKEVALEVVLRRVDRVAEEFRKLNFRCPVSANELIQAGLLAERPVDPFGGEILVGADCRAKSSEAERLTIYQHED